MYYFIYENINIYLFFVQNILLVISGVLVIISINPIISVLFLITLFLCVSIYLILIGINFIGISYLLVYIGAVSILFLFILMLINIRISELHTETKNSLFLSIIIGVLLYIYNLNPNIDKYLDSLYSPSKNNLISLIKFNLLKDKVYVSSNNWESNLLDSSDIVSIGNILYTNLSIWLLISLLILLLAMIGCIVINITRKD